jgi:chromosome segregation ATPase
MKINFILLIVLSVLITLCVTSTAPAGHYTIKLTNGQEIVVNKYWDEGKTIRFYTNGGSVGIPKENIQNIVQQADDAPAAATGKQVISLPYGPDAEQEVKNEGSPAAAVKQTEKEQLEIKEKIEIVKANTATLTERKNKFLAQRTVAFDAKLKAEGQLEKARTAPYITTSDRKQAEESEQRKIIDAETQIKDADQAIADLEEMIAKQETLLRNLEDRLR